MKIPIPTQTITSGASCLIRKNPMKTRMTATSQKLSRLCKHVTASLMAAVALTSVALATDDTCSTAGPCPSGGPAGAVFTSDLGCNKINGNIYALKTDVYLNGGSTAANRLNGCYYVRVLSPMGTVLGTSDGLVLFSSDSCLQLWSIVLKTSDATQGYDDTDNNGGEYKVEVSCDPTFDPSDTKSDNFKVRASAFCVGDCPLAISCPLAFTNDCEGANGAHVSYEDPIVMGGTPPYTVVCSPTNGALFPSGVTTVSCNVTDAALATASCSFTVTVPSCGPTCTFTCGPDVPAGCGNSLVGDICGRTVTYIPPDCSGSTVVCQPTNNAFFPVGTNIVTCTATDPTAGTQTCTFKVIVTDPGMPVLSGCPTANTNVQCYANVPTAPTVTATNACGDNVDVVLSVSESNQGSSCSNLITRCWAATNACGDVAKCTQTILVKDTNGPTLGPCPQNISVNGAGSCCKIVTFTAPTASDACSGSATVTCAPDSGASFCVGTTIVTCSATDTCNNASSCSFTVTVKGQICVTKFYDSDFSGSQNGTEGVISGWGITNSDGQVGFTGTDGKVCFNVTNGTYTLTEQVKAGYVATAGTTRTGVLVNSTHCSQSVSFGNLRTASTGALTMGFWQNKNGQGIITGQAKTGLCPSAGWLRQYAPFQDLSATATCAQVATYVYNTIKAANASGSSMNAMLKAQMLATALDVYFSDPGLGGNKINAPVPVGGVSIDLQAICKMIDNLTTGTATCGGTYINVSQCVAPCTTGGGVSASGGATCLTVSQLLAYAASQATLATPTNPLASPWYCQVKTVQECAKNAFDAINNQVAFACGP